MRVWIFWVWGRVVRVGVGGDVNVHCDCNHIVHSLALPHVRHATLLHVLLRFHTYVMLRCCTFSCASTHTSCNAAARSFALPHTSCNAAARSFALPHIRHAMLLHVLLHFHTYVMLCCCTFSGAFTHTSCYEPEQLAMLMVAKLGKEPPNNKCQKNASNGKTLPATAVSL